MKRVDITGAPLDTLSGPTPDSQERFSATRFISPTSTVIPLLFVLLLAALRISQAAPIKPRPAATEGR